MTAAIDLLERGYFPRELPPTFTTVNFASFVAAQGGTPPHLPGQTRCVSHNLGRPGGLRRALRPPNPFSYRVLCEEIEKHWPLIVAHLQGARLSASRPRATKVLGRAVVPRLQHSQLRILRARRWRGSRYLLKTDITQFYPSIYTHSIPWALHTKAVAKAAIGGPPLPGDYVDRMSRRLQWGQTVGIPIGPDTSFLIAELILTAVDATLSVRLPALRGFRHIDDYELSFRRLADAEATLVELQSVLAEYELMLNPRKTVIIEMPHPLDEAWASELSRFPIRASRRAKVTDFVGLFDRAIELARHHREQPVIRYATMRLRAEVVPSEGWRTFQNLIFNAATADPSALPAVLGVLFEVATKAGHTVHTGGLAETIESIIERHAPLAHGSEVAWCVWAAIAFAIPLSTAAASAVSKMEDDVVALLALHADSNGLFPVGALDRARWATLVSAPDAVMADHWLLAYEANLKRWLPSPTIAADPGFSVVARAGVGFYDPAFAVPMFPAAALGIPGGTLGADYG
jgi:hypothetical protein